MFIFAFIKKISFSVKKYNIKKGTENEGNPTRNKHFGMAQSQLPPIRPDLTIPRYGETY